MGKKWLIVGILLVMAVLLVVIGFLVYNFYFASVGESNPMNNPTSGLTTEKAVEIFDESFIRYMLYTMNVQDLHNVPLTSDKPKISIKTEDKNYYAEVDNGVINVFEGDKNEVDMIINTKKIAVVKNLKGEQSIIDSFNSGESDMELVAGKTTLFAKGYLSLYEDITGEKITGNVIWFYRG